MSRFISIKTKFFTHKIDINAITNVIKKESIFRTPIVRVTTEYEITKSVGVIFPAVFIKTQPYMEFYNTNLYFNNSIERDDCYHKLRQMIDNKKIN
jgi:hypothetical protein